MSGQKTKEVLVALLPRIGSLQTLQSEGWYHIPVKHAPEKRMPPKVLAFYQGKVFGKEEAYKIRYFGEVGQIDKVPRKELLPDDDENKHKAEDLYYRLQLKTLEERFTPIVSYRPRRICLSVVVSHHLGPRCWSIPSGRVLLAPYRVCIRTSA